MQKCSLCGGRVINGRCEDCGLPIPPEHTYTLRGESAHYHRVNGEDVLHRVRPKGNRPDVEGYAEEEHTAHIHESGTDRHEEPRSASNTHSIATGCFVIVVALMVILPMLFSYFSNSHYLGGGGFIHDGTNEAVELIPEEDSYDPYEQLRGLMPADGTDWDGDLTSGLYIVGQDLPAGTYTIECTDENAIASIRYVNDEYCIRADENLYGYAAEYARQSDIPMPNGTVLLLDTNRALYFHTSNAPGYAMPAPRENPNAEMYCITATAEADAVTYTVGEDIAPGVYDVIVTAGDYGYFDFDLSFESTGMMYCGVWLQPDGQNTLQHIRLQQGTTVSAQGFGQYDFVVELHPSEFIYE